MNENIIKLEFSVMNVDGEMRISEYLKKRLGFSSSLITKVKYGGVLLNGETVTMRKTVKSLDGITVFLREEESPNVEPMDIPIDVIYDDDFLMAVNKPPNMPTHPSRGNSLPTLANAVAFYLKRPFTFRAVNRLDRGTGGIVIIAKNAYSASILGRYMKEGLFEKKYTALVSGILEPPEGRVDAPIARETEGSVKRVIRADGKRAITDYTLTRVTKKGNSVCKISLHTGRTHQIRVHMAHIGHPLVGDFLYGEASSEGYKLYADEISFPHPNGMGRLTLKTNDTVTED